MRDAPEAELHVVTTNSNQTEQLGEVIGAWLQPGDVVLLHGDLGAGKTTLTKGIARVLGVHDTVSSPSFALVNEYALPDLALYHLDLYRLDDEADLESIGFAELTTREHGIAIIEWPERAGASLPEHYLLIEMAYAGEGQRTVQVRGVPATAWSDRLKALQHSVPALQSA